ncbi:S-layer homology domain-containing protein [Salibacterium aidingense]|uniref:S-layer homology domain-containing protein n=1 Tax=Salibacterium aidingense TaxID=384933 RepID=UPI0004020B7D|nr:S-layer homology domain-containing protein [Salibacterium aidingense]
MKKFSGIALSATLAASLTFPAAAGAQDSFSDIGDSFWAKDAISHLQEQGIITGYSDGSFGPNDEVTRGQAALMLAEAMELNTANRPDPGFSDIDEDSEWYAAVAAVADEGIIEGYDDEFQPNEPLTRAQMAKVLAEAYDLSGNGDSEFSDISEDFWAYEYIDALAANDIASGYEDGTYQPGDTTTRAQFATFVRNSIDDGEDNESTPEVDEEIAGVLEDVMAQQQELDSYTFDGSVGLILDVPMEDENLSEEEQEMLEESMNMEMDIRGTFQKDPLLTEAIVEQEIPQFDETVENVSLATEDASYQYITDAAFMGYPEDWQDKYIEMKYEDIFDGETPENLYDMEQQQEMMEEVYDVLLENFGTQYFELQDSHEAIPEDVDYEQVLTFEITNDDLDELTTILEEEVLPELEPILENPGSASSVFSAVGSNVQALDEENAIPEEDISEEDIEELLENLNLETFEMHQAINEDNNIVYDAGEVEVSYSDEEQGDMSFGFNYGLASSGFNEDVTFEYGLPESEDDIISYDELMDWQEEQMQDFEEIEEEDLENLE